MSIQFHQAPEASFSSWVLENRFNADSSLDVYLHSQESVFFTQALLKKSLDRSIEQTATSL
jgi:hypothetical protein